MEDMEELEDDLFGTISRRKNISPNEDATKFNRQSTTGIKKKVVFHGSLVHFYFINLKIKNFFLRCFVLNI